MSHRHRRHFNDIPRSGPPQSQFIVVRRWRWKTLSASVLVIMSAAISAVGMSANLTLPSVLSSRILNTRRCTWREFLPVESRWHRTVSLCCAPTPQLRAASGSPPGTASCPQSGPSWSSLLGFWSPSVRLREPCRRGSVAVESVDGLAPPLPMTDALVTAR